MHQRTLFIALAAAGVVAAAVAVVLGDSSENDTTATPDYIYPPPGSPAPGDPDPDPTPDEPPDPDEPAPAARCAADAPLPQNEADFDGGTLSASLSHGALATGGDDERYAVIELDTDPAEAGERPPLNVGILIDRSGSMRGDPIRHARRAALGLVERLGPDDRVAIATYDTHGEAVLPATAVTGDGAAEITDAIEGVTPRGMTNIHEGLAIAYDQLREARREGALSRVIHLSDGRANRGVTSTPEMANLAMQASDQGIRTTSIGLGLQYNEELMEALADAGRGGYYFVGDPSDLQPVFAGELDDLEATVATDVELAIRPRCDGVRVEEVIGVPTEREGDTLIASPADIAGDASRRFVARLDVEGLEPDAAQVPEAARLIDVALEHEDPRTGAEISSEIDLAAEVATSAEVADDSVVESVMAEVLAVQEAQAVHEAALAYRDGRHDEAMDRLAAEADDLERRVQRYGLSEEAAASAGGRARGLHGELRGASPGSAEAEAEALDSADDARGFQRASE